MNKQYSTEQYLKDKLKQFPEHQILERASEIVSQHFQMGEEFTSSEQTKTFLSYKLANKEREIFSVLFLTAQNSLIEYDEMFHGTVDSARVYPREVARKALKLNASSVIFAHNHPSGNPEPSHADINITRKLVDTLGLFDIRVLDHIIVGTDTLSMSERGLV